MRIVDNKGNRKKREKEENKIMKEIVTTTLLPVNHHTPTEGYTAARAKRISK